MSVKASATPVKATAKVPAQTEPQVTPGVMPKVPETKVTDTPAAVTWDDLPSAEVATYQQAPTRRDLEASTPDVIKARVKGGFEATAKAGSPVWFVQNCGTRERAEAFILAARKYATFTELTFRGALDPKQTNQVRYSVRVKEARKRLTDAEKQAREAKKAVAAAVAAKVAEAKK
jgi:hypothetical protein